MKFIHQRRLHLKIKIKTLVEESKIIRHEENKFKWEDESKNEYPRFRLRTHRVGTVREHIRLNLLAYGALRNIPYCKMEQKCAKAPDFEKINKIVLTFEKQNASISSWIKEAKEYLSSR